MRSNSRLIVLQFTILLFFTFVVPAIAQQGSVYFSAGYNTSWYKSSTIHIEQEELQNSYDLWKVKGNNKTNSTIGPLLLNYRLGYYFNEWQDLGLELNYDPVRYTVADGSVVSINGMVNGMLNVKSTAYFSRKNGSYYYFDGLNLFLVNLVKRWRVYRANTAAVSVDVLGKAGIGPAMPHFHSNLPVNPLSGPALTYGGWDWGLETAVRVTLYRYAYLEFAAKYDYASMDGLQIYDGTASQNLNTYELIATVGFTIPTTRLNPLFHKEKRIITMLPWYQHKGELGKAVPEQEAGVSTDSVSAPADFGDIVGKNAESFNLDSLASADSTAQAIAALSDTTEAPKHKRRRRRHRKEEVADTVAAPVADTSVAAPPPMDTVKPAPPPPPPHVDTTTPPPPAPPVAPAAPEVKEEAKKIIKEAIEGVNFESSKDIIQKSSYKILNQVVKMMKDYPEYKLQINGHTDSHGSAAFNKTLSQKRSAAVKKYLVAHGVAASRMKTAGYGGEKPITTNETEEGRLKNRRVEFIIE